MRPVSIMSIMRDDADQARQPHRAAAADEDAARCPRAARNRPSARRRGCGTPPQARARRRPPRRAAPRPPARGRTRSASNTRCHMRECCTPSATLRSVSSQRSRPAEKCSPSPFSTTGLDVVRQRLEERLEAEHRVVVQRVALLRPRQPQDRDVAFAAHGQRVGKRDGRVWLGGGMSLCLSHAGAICPPLCLAGCRLAGGLPRS